MYFLPQSYLFNKILIFLVKGTCYSKPGSVPSQGVHLGLFRLGQYRAAKILNMLVVYAQLTTSLEKSASPSPALRSMVVSHLGLVDFSTILSRHCRNFRTCRPVLQAMEFCRTASHTLRCSSAANSISIWLGMDR